MHVKEPSLQIMKYIFLYEFCVDMLFSKYFFEGA